MEPYQKLNRSVEGKTAIITGAASGMGRATAMVFADAGANVMITDMNADGIAAVEKELRDNGWNNVMSKAMDLQDHDAIRATVAETVEKFGTVDIVVNNAGFSRKAHPSETDIYEDYWDVALDVMLTAQDRMNRAALPYLLKSPEGGRVVNIASTEALGATPHNAAYVVAKHGVIGLTRSMAVDLGRDNITVNCICPGPIRTGMTDRISEEHKEIFVKRRVPMRRYAIPEEVANMTLSLCLPAASFITGAVIPVDGGLTIKNA